MNLLDRKKNNAVKFGDNNLGQLPQSTYNNSYHSNFDYTDININDKESLMRYESAISQKTREVATSLVEIGKYLTEAEAVFRKYNAENSDKEPVKYQEWYEGLGYNAKSVSISKRAFEICSKYGTIVEDFSGKMIEAITSKDMKANPEIQEEIIEKIKTGEIKTVKDVKEYKDKSLDIIPPKKEKTTLPEVKCAEKEQNTYNKVEEQEVILTEIESINTEEPELIENINLSENLEQEVVRYIENVRYSHEISSEEIYKQLEELFYK